MGDRMTQELHDQVEHLRFALAEVTAAPDWFEGLGKKESRLVGALVRAEGRIISHDGLLAAMNFDRPDCDWPGPDVVRVTVCHVKPKLANAPGRIESVRDVGYRWVKFDAEDTSAPTSGSAREFPAGVSPLSISAGPEVRREPDMRPTGVFLPPNLAEPSGSVPFAGGIRRDR